MKVNDLKENLSGTTAELQLTKGKLTSLMEEHKALKETKLAILEKENKTLVHKQSETKLQVIYTVMCVTLKLYSVVLY